jgi:hypothetical protein
MKGTGRGGGTVTTLTLKERQDADGVWHQVMRDVCYGCGCPYLVAEDDHDLVWEPGPKRARGCTDDRCECHASPLVGERRE